MEFGGPKRDLTDVNIAGAYLVDEKFKDVVDELEPDTHQFFPVELFWSDGSSAGQRYWFFPCNRLDTVDEERTTKKRRGKLWHPGRDFENDGQFVFNRSQINGHHIWIDRFMVGIIGILMSNQMHDALLAEGVTGMGFNKFEETG
ncbi:imm11 family protein [Maritalea mobilis]|uniref:imm11 family protein n=1 Tax=Maritalea mobilis TaxID=483324 RepID=UPI003CCC8181